MAEDKLALINSALRCLGEPKVLALDETTISEALSDGYDEVRESLLRTHHFNFARKREQLTAVTISSVEEVEYKYAFNEPADLVAIIELSFNGDFENGRITDYVHENGRILTAYETTFIRYIFNQTDTTKFDVLFDKYLPAALALDNVEMVNLSSTKIQVLQRKYKDYRYMAESANLRDTGPRRKRAGNWRMSRTGNRSNGRVY